MATKFGRMITYLDRFLPIKSHVPLITRSSEITWQNKTTMYQLSEQGLVGSWCAPAHKVIWPFDFVDLRDHVATWNYYMFTTIVSLATKLGKLVTYHVELASMLLYPLVAWSCEITWQTKTIISSLHNIYGPKTRQDGGLLLLPSTHKVL